MKRVILPLNKDVLQTLHVGEIVYLTGTIYTARDVAHKRIIESLERNEPPPFDYTGQIIYFAGPSQAAPSQVIGSIGPTTSARMDSYTPKLVSTGLAGCIGKGRIDKKVRDCMLENEAIYFVAVGGAGAYLSKCIKKSEVVAYEDLGAECILKLYAEDFPVFVATDTKGGYIYE